MLMQFSTHVYGFHKNIKQISSQPEAGTILSHPQNHGKSDCIVSILQSAWWHQFIVGINVDFPSKVVCGIYPRAITPFKITTSG